MDQKQLTHIEPLNLPNQQLMLCALGEQQLNDLGHLELRYVHDTMVVPLIFPPIEKFFTFLLYF